MVSFATSLLLGLTSPTSICNLINAFHRKISSNRLQKWA